MLDAVHLLTMTPRTPPESAELHYYLFHVSEKSGQGSLLREWLDLNLGPTKMGTRGFQAFKRASSSSLVSRSLVSGSAQEGAAERSWRSPPERQVLCKHSPNSSFLV